MSYHLRNDLHEGSQSPVDAKYLEQFGIPEDDIEAVEPPAPSHSGRGTAQGQGNEKESAAEEVDDVPGVTQPHTHLQANFHRLTSRYLTHKIQHHNLHTCSTTHITP